MLDENRLRRFHAKIDRSGECWIWTASKTHSGYGQFWTGAMTGKGHQLPTGAHRVSYELHVGPIPDGLHVLHRCDVPACVNPDHLFVGTQAENMRDMTQKGRHGRTKLTADAVREIRSSTLPLRVFSDRYGVSISTVSRARRGESH